jgi:hypothetical protein
VETLPRKTVNTKARKGFSIASKKPSGEKRNIEQAVAWLFAPWDLGRTSER